MLNLGRQAEHVGADANAPDAATNKLQVIVNHFRESISEDDPIAAYDVAA